MGLMDLITGGAKGMPRPLTVIAELNRARIPVRVEIEGAMTHFHSRVLLRSGAVVLTYPQHLEPYIKVDGWVRLRPTEDANHDLRLQISSARYGGSGPLAVDFGQMALLCKIPNASYEESKRASERFNTSRFHDILLELRGHPLAYPVINLSMGGARIRLPEDASIEKFVVGTTAAEWGALHLGTKAHIEVLSAKIRHAEDGVVGLEIEFNLEGPTHKILEIFFDGLREEEKRGETPP